MSIAAHNSVEIVRAFPHVSGMSRRVKAAPLALTRTAATMMCASGVFSTTAQTPTFRAWRFIAAAALVVTAATLAIAGDHRPANEARSTQLLVAQSDAFASLGVAAYAPPAALDALAPAAGPTALDAQDRFEIARMHRMAAGSR